MTGGLLNIQSYGKNNLILTGNPSKSFFKSSYSKYTNFGKQLFRLDYEGEKYLHLNEKTKYRFKVKRYADLLSETFLVITLPNIWSPLCKIEDDGYRGYEFKWIKNIGCQIVKKISFIIGGQTIQEFGGDYLYNLVERDFPSSRKNMFYKMTGNVPELNDPANAYSRGVYPHAAYPSDGIEDGIEPSIRSREIYIPLNIWFSLNSKMAFPLLCLQYSELEIDIELRPLKELYVIKDITNSDTTLRNVYVQPNLTNEDHAFYRFIHEPPAPTETDEYWDTYKYEYTDTRINWASDIHIKSNYIFLSDEERFVLTTKEQTYLIKEVYTKQFNKIVNNNKVNIDSQGMVANYMFYLQRDDSYKRNEWTNYTNWEYGWIPYPYVIPDSSNTSYTFSEYEKRMLRVSGLYKTENTKDILTSWALVLDGKYRENTQKGGVIEYIETYNRSIGDKPDGLYNYNFCLDTSPFITQPSGAMNLNNFSSVEFEVVTSTPPINPNSTFYTTCDADGITTSIRKEASSIYTYTYDLIVHEERYNMLIFKNGNAGLAYAR